MAETRTCHVCETVTDTYCPTCVAAFEQRREASTMTLEEKEAELKVLFGPLEIPFSNVHQRIEELLGRPVWTHELGLRKEEDFVQELRSQEHPSMSEIIGLIPPDKQVIVLVADDGAEDGAARGVGGL